MSTSPSPSPAPAARLSLLHPTSPLHVCRHGFTPLDETQRAWLDAWLAARPELAYERDDQFGWTPIMWAAMRGAHEWFEALLPHSDLRAKANGKLQHADWSVAHVAAFSSSNPNIVRLLAPWLASFQLGNLCDANGDTPLMIAAYWGRVDALRLLLPASDPRHVSDNGATALMVAIQTPDGDACAQAEIVRLLLPLSDLERRNADGQSAIDLALARPDSSAATLIREHLAKKEAEALRPALDRAPIRLASSAEEQGAGMRKNGAQSCIDATAVPPPELFGQPGVGRAAHRVIGTRAQRL